MKGGIRPEPRPFRWSNPHGNRSTCGFASPTPATPARSEKVRKLLIRVQTGGRLMTPKSEMRREAALWLLQPAQEGTPVPLHPPAAAPPDRTLSDISGIRPQSRPGFRAAIRSARDAARPSHVVLGRPNPASADGPNDNPGSGRSDRAYRQRPVCRGRGRGSA